MSRIEKATRCDELIDFQTLARESARQEEERVLAEELHHVPTWSETCLLYTSPSPRDRG